MIRSELRDLVLLYLATNPKGGSYKELENFISLIDGSYYSEPKYLSLSLYRTLREMRKAGLLYKTKRYRGTFMLTDFGLEVASHTLARTLIKVLLLERMLLKNKDGG